METTGKQKGQRCFNFPLEMDDAQECHPLNWQKYKRPRVGERLLKY